MRRRIVLWLAMSMLTCGSMHAADELVSEGPPAPAVMFEHFPDRLHACVWRNWDLVPTATLARVVGATEEQLAAVAASMGLPPNRPVSDQLQRQVYITIVRRNWHLLPLEQLLELIGMSREEFAFRLREDDVLYIKLGPKPHCEPLRYVEPDDAAKRRAAEIKAVVERHFGDEFTGPSEERFA